MKLTADRLGEMLEDLVADRRARIVGVSIAALMVLSSFGFLAAARSSTERERGSVTSHLPTSALSLPILRSLPEPQPRKAGAKKVADPSRPGGVKYVTAQR